VITGRATVTKPSLPQALLDLGGAGKTAVAIEEAYLYSAD
jgi:hypothetical protein